MKNITRENTMKMYETRDEKWNKIRKSDKRDDKRGLRL